MNFRFTKILNKKIVKKHLQKLQNVLRHKHHPLIHQIHQVHKISRKTLFYVKEYGPHSNVPKTILKESIKIILLASLLSSFGGFALEEIKSLFLTMIPLIILLPALNDMVGDYGTIVSARFSTMLHEGLVEKKWWKEAAVQKLFWQIMITASITAIMSALIALILTAVMEPGSTFTALFAVKIFAITLIDVLALVSILFFVAIIAGLHYFNLKEDPNNFLIPITTSVADFGNMFVLAVLIVVFF
ncbi:magnesium transporter [Candidatus Woesearchaeota archaeon]|nr:magnesium transporter [Candidatus Woesearchaeota archaeon]